MDAYRSMPMSSGVVGCAKCIYIRLYVCVSHPKQDNKCVAITTEYRKYI